MGRGQGARRPSYFFSGLLCLFVFPSRLDGSLRSQGCPLLSSLHISFSGSCTGWTVHGIFITLHADKSLPTFPRYAAKFLLLPARQPHNANIKLFYNKIFCGNKPFEELIFYT